MRKKLKDIISVLKYSPIKLEKIYGEDILLDTEINDITIDSRKVKNGALFICIEGHKLDGHNFAKDAVKAGAVSIVAKKPIKDINKEKIVQIIVSDTRWAEAILSAFFYNYPTRKLLTIGVTGTNGKTTTVYLLESILKTSGKRTGVLSTIEYRFGTERFTPQNTTPCASDLNRFLYNILQKGGEAICMEVSSHALVQRRVEEIDFDIAVLTNITRDHLDFHSSFEEYVKAKTQLFYILEKSFEKGLGKFAIINADEVHAERFIKACGKSTTLINYGINSRAVISASEIDLSEWNNGTSFLLRSPAGTIAVNLKLKGLFNVYNALAAAACGFALNLPLEIIKEGLEKISHVPGRLQTVECGQDFLVIVDYAHTPDALVNLLGTVRNAISPSKKVILVFGCGGDRDRGKRPMMGEVAGKFADFVIVTSDNPRSEDPAKIALDIEIGLRRSKKSRSDYAIILDRKEAIRSAVNYAQTGDAVIIAGKGHEKFQILKNEIISFDDYTIVSESIKERLNNNI